MNKFTATFWKIGSRRRLILTLLAVLLAGAMVISLQLGALPLDFARLVDILWNSPDDTAAKIVWEVRLPRILLGALVGGAFAVSGAILQSIMRNVLASPDLLGISSGGALAAILIALSWPQFAGMVVPAAFAGALLTALAVYLLAWRQGVQPVRLILAGVALSSLLGAGAGTVLLFHAERAGSILSFTLGSLAGRGKAQLEMVIWYLPGAFALAFLLARKLNILALGDEVAVSLGLKVERVRLLLLAIAALLAASAVSVVGLMGFVGLIAPHIVRLLIGSDNRYLLPASALLGALLVVVCDTAGRMVITPAEMPAGVLLALAGPIFFLWLLRRRAI